MKRLSVKSTPGHSIERMFNRLCRAAAAHATE